MISVYSIVLGWELKSVIGLGSKLLLPFYLGPWFNLCKKKCTSIKRENKPIKKQIKAV